MSFLRAPAPAFASPLPASLFIGSAACQDASVSTPRRLQRQRETCQPVRAPRRAPSATATAPRAREQLSRSSAAVSARHVDVYDTSLRDGAQGEGISFSLADKLKLATRLDAFGVSYVEGGYPGSNEKDSQFFENVPGTMVSGTRVVAFGNTRYKNTTCEADRNVQALKSADTPVVTLVGKAWGMQVEVVLETTREENLAMIGETVRYFKNLGKEVMLDAEHFFDGYKDCAEYALATLGAAADAGVDVLVLCDTNGGSLPWEIEEMTAAVVSAFPEVRVGIHCHNDMDLAVANTISAVHAGASLVQGCVNGYGERTGNANLMSVIPSLQLKMGFKCVGDTLKELTAVSRYFDEVANLQPNTAQPFTGVSAFAHKGGLHVAAVLKDPDTYQFIDPSAVGNERRMLVSELSGRHNILSKAKELGFDIDSPEESGADWNGRARAILHQVKDLENKGFTFEGADASIELFVRRKLVGYRPPFELIDFNVLTGNKRVQYSSDPSVPPRNESVTTATVKIALLGPSDGSNENMCPTKICLEVGESTSGPVDAVNIALNKALHTAYPSLSVVSLVDYKVRILDPNAATGATTRVMVEFKNSDSGESWTTGMFSGSAYFWLSLSH